jgi:hypothetical protein
MEANDAEYFTQFIVKAIDRLTAAVDRNTIAVLAIHPQDARVSYALPEFKAIESARKASGD